MSCTKYWSTNEKNDFFVARTTIESEGIFVKNTRPKGEVLI
jgi:hypothetical protein